MYLGTSDERRDLLPQEACSAWGSRFGRAIASLAVILLVVALAAVAVLLGLVEKIGWVANYLFPVVALSGVFVGVSALVVRGLASSMSGVTRSTSLLFSYWVRISRGARPRLGSGGTT
jgi:hypothetical protein